jgi:prepilin-type N-terminal cleavage/methylation domain-containing protein
MTRRNLQCRRDIGVSGMTLVELLVVVAILGLLAVTVLPNLASTSESRRTREAARSLSSAIAHCQSRAIGRQTWSGYALIAATPSSYAALDLYKMDQPEAYRGDTIPAYVELMNGPTGTRLAVSPSGASPLALSGTVGVAAGDLMRFNGGGPWYEIDSGTAGGAAVTGSSIRFHHLGSTGASSSHELFGANARTTPWPASPPARHAFEVLRKPIRSGTPTPLPAGRCVDLRWSCFGPATSSAFSTLQPVASGTFSGFPAGSELVVLFDGTGSVREYVVNHSGATTRYTVAGPLFLLIGRADRAGNMPVTPLNPQDDSLGANWQYSDSYWLALDPATGQCRVAECRPSTLPLVAPYADACVASQEWIRAALLAGGG